MRKSRAQHRVERQRHGLVRAKDQLKRGKQVSGESLCVGREDLCRLQRNDASLAGVQRMAEREGSNFFWANGLLMRRWGSAGKGAGSEVDQIVLPKECRREVLRLARTIPLVEHLGRKKTTQQVLRRFYWLTIYADVADYCGSCEWCQKSTQHRVAHAPLVSLPVVDSQG